MVTSPVKFLPDYACRIDGDKRNLDKVGVKNVEMYRKDWTDKRVLTSQSAYIPVHGSNGAHMSRLLRSIMDAKDMPIEMDNEFLIGLAGSHDCDTVYWECNWRTEYEGEIPFMMDISLEGSLLKGIPSWYLTFTVPYASVCPCSHEMVTSEGFGVPHMQRSKVTITGELKGGELDWILADAVSKVINAVQLIPESMMKRPDELDWCQRAAKTNLFVEDAARNVADRMDSVFADWVVRAEHMESIHQHNVVAVCKKGEKLI